MERLSKEGRSMQVDLSSLPASSSRSTFLTRLSKQDHDTLLSYMSRLKVGRGVELMTYQEPATQMYLIVSGEAKVIRPLPTGEVAIVSLLSAGELIGEIEMIDGDPCDASVITIGPTEVLVLKRPEFNTFLSKCPMAMFELMKVMARRLREDNSRLEEAYYMSLESRVARRLLELGERWGKTEGGKVIIDLPVTQTELAGLVGASRQRVNRTLTAWQDQGLIRFDGRQRLVVETPARLIQLGMN